MSQMLLQSLATAMWFIAAAQARAQQRQHPQMLKLEGTTAEGLEQSLGSAGSGLSAWLASASVADDGELASIAGTATTARFRAAYPRDGRRCMPARCSAVLARNHENNLVDNPSRRAHIKHSSLISRCSHDLCCTPDR